ncbi:MAG: ABC transporter permease [Dehalococcoidia bacterium]|nr:ABC transporter permease [Dehalococcoidia bacterium]MCB9484782.1 ABC transporter permease [Thermoflexaceae bacterium]
MTAIVADLQAPAAAEQPKRWRMVRTMVRKKVAMAALAVIVVFYAAGIFAPVIVAVTPLPGPNEQPRPLTIELRNAGPSSDHLLGTDALGRDLLSRILYAARTTILFTFVVVVTGGLFIGLGLGLLAGYRGGWIDTLIMRIGEVLAGVPTLILMLAITAAFRSRITQFSFDLGDNTFLSTEDARAAVQFLILVGASVPFAWVGSSRIVRSVVLSIREQAYVQAAESMGASTRRILFRHVLPGVMPLWVVGVSGGMGAIAMAEVSLSFLGLGITPPTASFGTLISDGAGPLTFKNNPHLLLAPAIPVILFYLAWNLLGDALVDILEPRSTTHR